MMSNDIQNEIIERLRVKPNQNANELASDIGCQPDEVKKLLYGHLKSQVKQDRSYRWKLVALTESGAAPEVEEEGFANTDLALLCQ